MSTEEQEAKTQEAARRQFLTNLQLDRLAREISQRREEWESLLQQKLNTLDVVAEKRLSRQIEQIEEKIAELEAERQTLSSGILLDEIAKLEAERQTLAPGVQLEEIATKSPRSLNLGNGVSLTLVYIPGGTFWMGSKDDDRDARDNEKPRHQVTVPAFWMGETPVTQSQYQAVIGKNPSHFQGDDRPVEMVSWDDAMQFCQELSKKVKEAISLPSESQWEYACRAGTTTPYYFGDTLTPELARCKKSLLTSLALWRGETAPACSYPPNDWEFYDMHGNVWEWCLDHWHGNYQGAPTYGSAWFSSDDSATRLVRGGSWNYSPGYCRSAYRNSYSRAHRNYNIGFRVACPAPRTR
ncbi:MAG: hypothetical protein RLZZ435_3469 [Cyanobacteriota bacterium]